MFRRNSTNNFRISVRHSVDNENSEKVSHGRRAIILTPLVAVGVSFLRSAVVKADEKLPESVVVAHPVEKVEEKIEEISSRIYDATSIGEPLAVGKDKSKVWEKVMNARVVYLGEAEQVPIRDDKELELEIVKSLRKRCVDSNRSLSLALEAFPYELQEQLDQFMDRRFDFF